MKIEVTRRQVATILAVLTGAGATALWLELSADDAPLSVDLPPLIDNGRPTFDVFLAMSLIVLAREQVDGDIARKMYEIFMREPWGQKHVSATYRKLRSALTMTDLLNRSGAAPAMSQLSADERWFITHLVTTWYLGVYYHEQRPTQRVTLDGALMYDAVRGLLVKPYAEHIGFSRWAEAPTDAERKQ